MAEGASSSSSASEGDMQLEPQVRRRRQNQPEDDLRDLNAEEMDKLVQLQVRTLGHYNTIRLNAASLQDMTGLEDVAICRALLESNGWDLEATAREQLGIPSEVPPRPQPAQPRLLPQAPDAPVIRAGRDRRAASPAEASTGILGWGFYLLTLPVTVPFRIVQTLFLTLADLLGLRLPLEGPRRGRAPSQPVRTAVEDVRRFTAELSLLVGPNTSLPDFKVVSYLQALEEAKRDLRFLLVYLHR